MGVFRVSTGKKCPRCVYIASRASGRHFTKFPTRVKSVWPSPTSQRYLTSYHTHSLLQVRSRAPDKPIFTLIVKTLPVFCGAKSFNIMFTGSRNWPLSWSKINSVHTRTSCLFFYELFYIVPSSRSSSFIFPSGSWTKILYVSRPCHMSYMTRSPHHFWFSHRNINSTVQFAKYIVIKFSPPPPDTSPLLGPNIQTHVTVCIGTCSVIQPCFVSGKGPPKLNGELFLPYVHPLPPFFFYSICISVAFMLLKLPDVSSIFRTERHYSELRQSHITQY
jgi:hypothetical protein